MDRVLPKEAIPYTERLEPHLRMERTENALPSVDKSTSDKLEPKRAMPYNEHELPRRAKVRREQELPSPMLSSIEHKLPTWMKP